MCKHDRHGGLKAVNEKPIGRDGLARNRPMHFGVTMVRWNESRSGAATPRTALQYAYSVELLVVARLPTLA